MEYLHKNLTDNGHTILNSITGNRDMLPNVEMQFMEADMILVNGEGTMHHDAPAAQQLLAILRNAKVLGKKTALINTVWQSMTINDEIKDVLSDTYISVREIKSQYEMYETIGRKVDLHLDLSYFVDVPTQNFEHKDLVIGKFFMQQDYRPENIPVLDIFKTEWNECVNTLRNTDWFVTGRHHELYAACKARCPSTVLSGNTWKNEGLFETAGVDIPCGDGKLLHDEIPNFIDECKEKKDEYTKLFDWMEAQPKWTCAKMSQVY
jgi:polysaccharide pyruvyl transferase WcaK-like protein